MYPFWALIAHGTLGIWDELLSVLAFVIFLIMLLIPLVVTTIKRSGKGQADPTLTPAVTLQPSERDPSSSDVEPAQPASSRRDHFRLD